VKSAGETLPPVRVSDAERDRALRALRDASAQGRLSTDTFAWRIERALRSRNRVELSDLTRDLPSRSPLADAIIRSASSMSAFINRVRDAWRSPRQDRLRLPGDTRHPYLLGRARDCDLLLKSPTVSRSHARLHHGPDGWVLTDLHSTNGTRVNGWRVTKPELLLPGDLVSFGSLTFLITS
jgi:hypothetical protein